MAGKQHMEHLMQQLDDNMPIHQAIEIITGIRKVNFYDPSQQRREYALTTAIFGGIVSMIGCFYHLLRVKKKTVARMNQLLVQEPIEMANVPLLLYRWRNSLDTTYNPVDVIKSQWDGVNLIRGVFVSGNAIGKKQMLLGRANLQLNSSYLQGCDIRQSFNNKPYQCQVFSTEESLQDFLAPHQPAQPRKQVRVHSVLPITNIALVPVQPPKTFLGKFHMLLSGLANNFSIMAGFGPCSLGPSVKVGLFDVCIYPAMPLCIFTDLLVKGDQVRFVNPKWIGQSYRSLSETMMNHYHQKLDRLNLLIAVTAFVTVGLVALHLSRKIQDSLLKAWAVQMELKYPRISEVTQPPTRAIALKGKDDPLICHTCKVNYIDLIFVPCYHFQQCQQCFEKNNHNTTCIVCNQAVFCGIPIHFA